MHRPLASLPPRFVSLVGALALAASAAGQSINVYTPQMTEDHTLAVSASPFVSPTVSGDGALALDPGAPLAPFVVGVTEGDLPAVPRHNLYAYRIADSLTTGTKATVIALSGNHNTETTGSHTFQGFVDFILSGDPLAAELRSLADFYVYPLVNPDGRFTMTGRGNPEMTREGFGSDHNRVWNAGGQGLSTIDALASAMHDDTGGDIDYLFDFHSAGSDFFYLTPALLSSPFALAMPAIGGIGPIVSTGHPGMSRIWSMTSGGLMCEFGYTPESGFTRSVAGYLDLGRDYALALLAALRDSTKATLPNPIDGATNVNPATQLSWAPGSGAVSHDVYLGTDAAAVAAADRASPEYRGNVSATTFNPGGLTASVAYDWRIDEIDAAGGVVAGDVWSFATADPPPPLAPVACWPLDGDARDAVGNRHGVVINALPAPDRFEEDNGALAFDGAGDYVRVPDFDYASPTVDFSLLFWFKTSDLAGPAFQYMFSHGNFDANDSLNVYFAEDSSGTVIGELRSRIRLADGTVWAFNLPAGLADGFWHLYAMTVSSTDGAVIYIDGVQRGAEPALVGAPFNPTTGVHFGARSDLDAARYFGAPGEDDGLLDDVCIFNRALTPGEVMEQFMGRPLAVPIVQTLPVADLTQTEATLRGDLLFGGVGAVDARIYWGASNGGDDPDAWENVVHLGQVAVGEFQLPLTDLIPGRAYAYRAHAANGVGGAWAETTEFFITPPGQTSAVAPRAWRGYR